MTQRYAFVLGTGRCGSTLVQEVLARHHDVGFVTNLDDRFGLRSGESQVRAYRNVPARVTRKGGARFAPSEAYRALEREVSPLLADSFRDLRADDVTPWLRERFIKFFDDRARRQGAPLFLHKFTGWPRIEFLDAILPDARFIHIVRDGRAVANSWLQMPWWRGHLGPQGWHFGPLPTPFETLWEESDRSFVVLAGLAWRLLIDRYDATAAGLPEDRWLELRYEDVVAAPVPSFAHMLDFLGLKWDQRFEQSLSRLSFSAARSDAYRSDLGESQISALNAVLGETLQRHGYA